LHEEGEEEVGDQDREGGEDHGVGRATPHSDRSLTGLEPLMAGDDHDENAKGEAFDDGDRDVGEVGVLLHVVVPVSGGNFEGEDPNDVGGKDAEGGGFGDEQRDRNEHGQEAGSDEKVDGVHGHRAKGIDLLGHFHRSYFCSHGRSHAARQHEPGDGRTEFAEHADTDQRSGEGFGIEDFELKEGLRGEDGPGEGASDNHHWLGAIANLRNLLENFPVTLAADEEGLDHLAQQACNFSKILEEAQDQVAGQTEE